MLTSTLATVKSVITTMHNNNTNDIIFNKFLQLHELTHEEADDEMYIQSLYENYLENKYNEFYKTL